MTCMKKEEKQVVTGSQVFSFPGWVTCLLITCLFSLSVLSFIPTQADAMANVSNTFITKEDQSLNPTHSQYDYYLKISDQWEIKQAEFQVYFRYSPTLISESNVSLFMDGKPYGTTRLIKGRNGQGSLKVVIPAKDLTPGFHQFSVGTYLQSSPYFCADRLNPANWLVLDKKSYIHVAYEPLYPKSTIQSFPQSFIGDDASPSWNTEIVVPNKATDAELEAAYQVVATLASYVPQESQAARVLRYNDWKKAPSKRNVIAVGQASSFPTEWQKKLTPLLKNKTQEGLLHQMTLYDGDQSSTRTYLFVSGEKEQQVQVAAKALRYPLLTKQINGYTATVSDNMVRKAENLAQTQLAPWQKASSDSVTLRDLGYHQVTLSNVFSESTSYQFATPPDWQYVKGAGFRLVYQHSEQVNKKTSSITVRINGVPVNTIALEGTTGKPKEAFIPFPSTLRTGEPINVVVQANLNIRDTGCDEVTNRLEHFVSILPESQFVGKHEQMKTAALSHFPNLFVDQDNQVKATALLSKEPNSVELTALAQLTAGAMKNVHDLQVTLKQGPETLETNSEHVWILDVNKQNKLLNQWKQDQGLQIHTTPNGLSSDVVPVLESSQVNGASIQQIFAHKEGQVALVISANTPEMLLAATTAMSDQTKVPAESKEEAAIVTSNGKVILLPLTSEAPIPVRTKLVNKVKGWYEYVNTAEGQAMMAVVVFVITVLIVLFFLIRSWKRKRRLENSNQKDKTDSDFRGKNGQSLTRIGRGPKKK
ncbi:hypothetical protein EEL30_02235 [Brevibacillus laterosporus]|uniref:Cellulose biosynthesis cyclic di-GMP-binding regulatory protein BcsB n=1 Tax=Brevibacillus laterosporus TaxID=1465 RepID=A0A518V2S4_BRELA|nr:hypothetical protein EEL30_02235 [Brevibacillus laterosporus]